MAPCITSTTLSKGLNTTIVDYLGSTGSTSLSGVTNKGVELTFANNRRLSALLMDQRLLGFQDAYSETQQLQQPALGSILSMEFDRLSIPIVSRQNCIHHTCQIKKNSNIKYTIIEASACCSIPKCMHIQITYFSLAGSFLKTSGAIHSGCSPISYLLVLYTFVR